jgi:hypothetical protein
VARSSYIYVVSEACGPVAAFTVKHELMTWLHHQPEDHLPPLHVFRCRDSPWREAPAPVDITLDVMP